MENIRVFNSQLVIIYFYVDNILIRPIITVGGQDISHWFDPETNEVSYFALKV